MSRRLAIAAYVVLLAGFAASAWAVGFGTPAFRAQLEAFVGSWGAWAPVAFVVVKTASVILAWPAAPMGFVGGVLFGPVAGTALNLLAATLGASATFWIGRRLARDEVEARLSGRLRELDEQLAERGLHAVIFLRLIPLFPFNGINYASGLTRVRFRDYALGTAIDMIPGATAFTWVGHGASGGSPAFAVAGLTALGLLALVPLAWRRWRGDGGARP